MDMRLRMVIATVIAGVGAPGMGNARLIAQETPDVLTGCHYLTVGEWEVESYPLLSRLFGPRRVPVPSERGDSTDYEVPPRIEFAGPSDPPYSGTAIVVPEGALPSVHAYMGGEIVGDSLDLWFSTGYGGVTAWLARSADGWVGTARTFIDINPYPVHARPITLTPVACDSPPPFSIGRRR